MSATIINIWWELVSAGLTLLLVYCAFDELRRRTQKRTRDLEIAAAMLSAHYEEMERFLGDSAAPASLRDLLIDLSDAVTERESARAFAKALSKPNRNAKNEVETVTLLNDLRELQVHRGDLATALRTSLAAGVGAMFFRWPELASKRDAFIARYTTQDEIAFAARTVRPHRQRDNDGHIDGGLAVA
jgi:hypothetical protein